MALVELPLGTTLDWDEAALFEFEHNPDGELGITLMHLIGEVVVAGAKKRALVRKDRYPGGSPIGQMRAEIRYHVGTDAGGLYCDIISPATNPDDGFPYPLMHEGKKVRDRRPHRSLRPALRDIKYIEVGYALSAL
jgi:hypothetical protein